MTEQTPGRKFVDGAKEFARDLGVRVVSKWIKDGYDEAGKVCISVVSGQIDELHAKNRSGRKLTQQEAHMLTVLTDIQAHMERNLTARWEEGVIPQ